MSTWILLRGLTRECRHWGGFPRLLEAALPGSAALPLELPGSGLLNAEPSPLAIARIAAGCRSRALALGAAPPYHLLALSMGGMVATAWAAAHPGEITASVLISTSFGRFSPPHRRLRPGAWPALLSILCRRSPEIRERLILELTSGFPREHAEVLAEWTAIRRANPVSPANALRQLLAAAGYRPPSAAPGPTLVLAGAADRLVDPDCSREIAHRWGCPLAVHPQAGHDLPLDDGPWVLATVRDWLATAQGGAGS